MYLVSILIQYRYAAFKLCRECSFYFQSIHLFLVTFVFVCVSVCKKIVIKKNKDLIYLKLSDGLILKQYSSSLSKTLVTHCSYPDFTGEHFKDRFTKDAMKDSSSTLLCRIAAYSPNTNT